MESPPTTRNVPFMTCMKAEACHAIMQVYITLQTLLMREGRGDAVSDCMDLRPKSENDGWLLSIVQKTIDGQLTGEEQSLVKFDRALATRGASGGVAADTKAIPPQFIPISQLVLLTLKTRGEMKQP
ncbi:unnamed protein product [Ostreobium quekettii]|uniref:Uncharacterized protein n=1 Tax=Ostreobium quekettii TaxID=121088 RepID=A0A8S1J8L9_9CHLO|nr:unnamed protein product [Ostreobium quekettii]|eukprot:evm.model.scf_313EXC.4 EVM.evm.TU.scf_313EXC.4   scf_313EXC:49018-49684(-)